ncbi:MAG: hypothetical protein LBK66_11210 [Spirochaetaceae bacterium]|jgi:hypothetical protein|nr:hypothetical protein [Spirochaetaceae bacterium]
MKREKDLKEILNKDFSVLNEKNKKSVINMTKFLVLTQNTIVPNILNEPSWPEERGISPQGE